MFDDVNGVVKHAVSSFVILLCSAIEIHKSLSDEYLISLVKGGTYDFWRFSMLQYRYTFR